MKKINVVLDFIKYPISEKVDFSKNTVTKMTGNSNFPTPDVPLAQITTAANNLETAYNAAQGGGTQLTAAMHAAEKVLDDLLRKQVLYVERIAFGNGNIILGSGFHISKQPASAHRPEFTVETGKKALDAFIDSTHESSMVLKRKAVKDAKAWVWQLCTDPMAEDKWTYAGFSTQINYTVNGLTPGIKYWFRSASISKEGLSQWSDPIAKIAV
ncbi:MAG: hypothetical protein HY958_00250 [Bacteroidia bacterium]|nr:hypothetical protein [Bacteroidia bacterium]